MIEPILELPEHLRRRLLRALETGEVAPPYPEAALGRALDGASATPGVREALAALHARGIDPSAIAVGIDLCERALAGVSSPDLVWSGPEVPGLHARDTRRVYEELIATARRELWISTFVYYDGKKAFKTLAEHMDANPDLRATLLLNIQRKYGDTTTSDDLVLHFAERLWKEGWPGERRPDVFYDPRSLDPKASGVLHAKAVVVDDESALVTSANLTEAAFAYNIEVGVLSRDRQLAASLARHFRVLIEQGLLVALPEA